MAKRSVLGGGLVLLVGVSVGVGAAGACSNYVPPDVPTYGPPNGLSTSKAPPAPEGAGDSGTTPPPTGNDAGGTPTGTTYACQTAGGTIVDGGPCSVSFSADIYPKMQAGTAPAWNCAGTTSGCHGSTAAVMPYLQGTPSPQAFYSALANFKTLTDGKGLPYIDPCSTDPTQSDFVCNTLGAGTTGECGGPMPLGVTLPPADLTMIATWVACGAPNN